MSTVFPLVAAGWRTGTCWAIETQYGLASTTAVDYTWVGAVQEIHATIDKQQLEVFRMNGTTDFPAYLLEGQRNVGLVVTYWPQDTQLLLQGIDQVGISTNSLTFEVYNYDTATYYVLTGCIPKTVQVTGNTGEALEIQVTYSCQNLMVPASPPIVYTDFPTDTGVTPFYFVENSVQVPAGTPKPQVLSFTATITTNIQQVYQFGLDYVRTIPTLTRTATGTLTATFDAFDTGTYDEGFANLANIPPTAQAAGSNSETTYTDPENAASGLSQQCLSIRLGIAYVGNLRNGSPTVYWLNFPGAVLPTIDLDTKITDLVALQLTWESTGVANSTYLLTGTTTSASSGGHTVTDSTASFPDLTGYFITFNSGPAQGQVATIASNTGTAITLDAPYLAPYPTTGGGDSYTIF